MAQPVQTGPPPQFIQVGPTLHPPVPLSCNTPSYLYPLLSPTKLPTKQSKSETRSQSHRVPERHAESEGSRRDDVELGLRPRRAARRHGDHHHHLVAGAAAVDAARAASAPAPARATPRPAPPCQEHRRRRGGGGGRGGGRLAWAAAAAAGAGTGGVAAAGVEARGGCRRRGGVPGRRFCHLRGERRRDGEGAEPDRRRPGGAQGVRGSGLRLQLPRDPRALRHAAGARALLLHEPALLGRAPAAQQGGGGGAGAGSGLASAARRHQLEDLQPWRQPGRGEGEAQVLGAGGGVHCQALQLIDQWRHHQFCQETCYRTRMKETQGICSTCSNRGTAGPTCNKSIPCCIQTKMLGLCIASERHDDHSFIHPSDRSTETEL